MFHDQPKVQDGYAFGKKTSNGDHVDTVIKAQNLSGLAERFNDIKEAKYASQQREPLGKSYTRGYQLPQVVQKEEFRFGVQTIGSENAKEVLYPMGGAMEERKDIAQMYRKTHGSFGPGEQRDRGYQWPMNKTTMSFGYGEQKQLNGAANAVHQERAEGGFPKTVIVKKTVEDFKSVTQDQLGKPKNLGQGKPPVPPNFAFGIKNLVGSDNWNAAKCIRGEPTERELLPDQDLGKSIKPGTRNIVKKPEDQNKVFGVPTIRTDIPYKEKRSVADYQNYGDEPEAIDLLFPSTFTEIGITEYDFQLPRPKEEVKLLFEKIGYSYKIGKFNAMYNRAKMLMPNQILGSDLVSVRAFMQAVNEMHHID